MQTVERAFHGLVQAITELEVKVVAINNDLLALSTVPRGFASEDEMPPEQRQKVEQLKAQRTALMQERYGLLQAQARHRMSVIKLAQQNEHLQRAQRNLEAVVKGKNPACGPTGGIYRVVM